MLAKRLISGAISFLIAGNLFAQQSPPRPQDAAERLAKTPMFAMGGVGFAGTTSKGEEDFRLVLQSPEAATAFEDLSL